MTQRAQYQRLDRPSAFDNKKDGVQNLLPPENKLSSFIGRVIRTILFVGAFLYIAKITHFREKILHDVRINRKFLYMFYFSSSVFIVFYLYMVITLRWLRPANRKIPVDKWDQASPKCLYTAAGFMVLSVLCFIFALWPTFQIMTFVLGILGFMSLIFVMQWIPF